MKKTSTRIICVFLTVAILLVSLPLTVFALSNESESQELVVSNLGSIDCGAIYHHLTDFGTNSIVITMDDGHKSVFNLAIPLLDKYNMK